MQDVKVDRHKYIGGSDIPIILGLSPFKSRYDLLLEKAQIKEVEFAGNKYTEFGDEMEAKIRNYYNEIKNLNFIETKKVVDDFRYHSDGFDESINTILEIKTTGAKNIKSSVYEYKTYISQLLFGMYLNNAKNGVLLVYERPIDMCIDFNKDLLNEYSVSIDDKEAIGLLELIKKETSLFLEDLERVKNAYIFENVILKEEELIQSDLVVLSNQIIQLENELIFFKEKQEQLTKMKENLKEAMIKENIKKWETPNGVKITLVADTPDKTEKAFDLDKFKTENDDLFNKYQIDKVKKGRNGYVKITL